MIAFGVPRLAISGTSVNFITHGNSLVRGEGASNQTTKSWPGRLQDMIGITVPNGGVGGQPISTMRTTAATVVDANLHATKTNILLGWEFTNEVSTNGRNAVNAHAQWVAYCNERRAAAAAAGKKLYIISLGLMPAAAGATTEITNARMAAMIAADNLLRANYRSYCDQFIDIAAHEPFRTLYLGGDWSHSAFNASGMYDRFGGGDGAANDRVHLGDAGYERIAEIVANALRRVRRT